jgi:hypothetical protein
MKGRVYGIYYLGLLKHRHRRVETTSEYSCKSITSFSVLHFTLQYVDLELVHKAWFLSYLDILHALPISPSLI